MYMTEFCIYHKQNMKMCCPYFLFTHTLGQNCGDFSDFCWISWKYRYTTFLYNTHLNNFFIHDTFANNLPINRVENKLKNATYASQYVFRSRYICHSMYSMLKLAHIYQPITYIKRLLIGLYRRMFDADEISWGWHYLQLCHILGTGTHCQPASYP